MTNYNCSAEADILSKYQDVFPGEFIEAVKKGVSWLCTHNNITYQTSIMVASDRVIYNTAGSSVLRIGLINVDLPLTGLTYYEVKSIDVAKDEVSGNIIFNVKMKYDTPMGISVTLVPITYFDPESNKEYYTKTEINALLNSLKITVDSKADSEVVETVFSSIDARLESLESTDNNEALTKLENKVDDILQSLALDFVTNDKLDEELAKLESGDKELDLTSYLKVKDAETTYLKIVDIGTKPELKGPAGKNGIDGTSVTVDEVKPVIVEALKTDDEFKLEVKGSDGLPGKDGISPTATDVADVLKADEEFKAEVKGSDAISPSVDEIGAAVKDEIIASLKSDDGFKNSVKGADGISVTVDEVKPVIVKALKTDEEFKASVKGSDADLSDYYNKLQIDEELAKKQNIVDFSLYAKASDIETVNEALQNKANSSALASKVDISELNKYLTKDEANTLYEPKSV